MITQLRPPQSRPVPGTQLRVSWSGVADADTVGAKLTGSTVRRFEGFHPPPGFMRSGDEWLIDLDRVVDVESIDLELRATTTGSRAVVVSDLHSEFEIEHVGLELAPRPEPYVFFRLARRDGGWRIEAKDGETGQVPVFVGGETVLVSIDRSASMIPWFRSGAVGRLLAAILDAAHAVDIPSIQVATAGARLDAPPQAIKTDANAAEQLARVIEAKRFTTGSAYVEAARDWLGNAAGGRKVAMLVTDTPPIESCAEWSAEGQLVIAAVGVTNLAESFDRDHWNALAGQGIGVVPVGDVQSGKAAVSTLAKALGTP